MHPVLTAFAEDAVAAHSSATDSPWELAWTLQEIQPGTTDHDLCLSCIYSQPFLLHCFFPCQEPSDTFLQCHMNIDLQAGIYGTEIGNKVWKKNLFCLKFSPKKLYLTKNSLLKKPLFSKEPARGPDHGKQAISVRATEVLHCLLIQLFLSLVLEFGISKWMGK